MSEHPALYLPFARRKYPGPSPQVIGESTELVLDGYTRSASTFAVYALQLAQDRPLRLAHHLHAPAQLIAGARAGLPTLLVIREPRGAILSQLVREPGVAMRDAVFSYVRFHESLRPYRDRMVVGEFETVTNDFGAVIRKLNKHFELSLSEFDSTAQNLADCRAMIEQRGSLSPVLLGYESGLVGRDAAERELRALQGRSASGALREAWVPSAQRERAKAQLAEQWSRPALAKLVAWATQVYAEFCGGTPTGPVTHRADAPSRQGIAFS